MRYRLPFSVLAIVGSLVLASACGGTSQTPAKPPQAAQSAPVKVAAAQTPAVDLQAVAKALVRSGMVKTGDKVLVAGPPDENALLEHIAIEVMKAGSQPVIRVTSNELVRRSYDEVPASFDSQPQSAELALANAFDMQISIDAIEEDELLIGVPVQRIASRNKMAKATSLAWLKKNARMIHLGNGLYPSATLAGRLGTSQAELATVFWKAALVPTAVIREKGEAILAALNKHAQVTISAANGTNLAVDVDIAKASVSDGALTPQKVKQGGSSGWTWLPAGDVLLPTVPGTANGKVVIDKYVFQGGMIEGLTLEFRRGKLTSMTATSGVAELQAFYAASGRGKDQFSYIDLGLNPEATVPTTTGRVIWMVAGGITIGVGDNTEWGGSNVSDFMMGCGVGPATLSAVERVLVENGVLK
jgi:leucyl aminopeptidase (aminopeptidase T)